MKAARLEAKAARDLAASEQRLKDALAGIKKPLPAEYLAALRAREDEYEAEKATATDEIRRGPNNA